MGPPRGLVLNLHSDYKNNSMKKRIPEIIAACAYFLFLHLIPNEFAWSDEYRFATWLRLGESFFLSHHALSSVSGYAVWAFTSLFGFEISAWDALRIVSELGATVGAVSLYVIGLWFGLSRIESGLGIGFFALSNGILRYGVSANPALGAIGLGLLGTLIGLHALRKKSLSLTIFSAFVWALAVAQHSVVGLLLAGFVITLLLAKMPIRLLATFVGVSGSGVVLGQLSVALLMRWAPLLVYSSYGDMLSKAGAMPLSYTLPWAIKTHVGVFFPGIHSTSKGLDLLLNFPRGLVIAIVIGIGVSTFRNRKKLIKKNGPAWSWGFLIGSGLLFAALCVLYPTSRQYAVMTWIGLGPAWVALITAAKQKMPHSVLLTALTVAGLGMCLHGIWGVEGAALLAEPRCPQLKRAFEPYGTFEKRKAPFPLFATETHLPPAKLFEINDIDCSTIEFPAQQQ